MGLRRFWFSTRAVAVLRSDTDDVGYQFHWDAETYLDLMRAEVPVYGSRSGGVVWLRRVPA